MTPSGIEPATSWLVARCLNELRHRAFPGVVCEKIQEFFSSVEFLKMQIALINRFKHVEMPIKYLYSVHYNAGLFIRL